MIAHLDGKIIFRGSRHIVIGVNGVGYKVYASLETMKHLPQKGQPASIFTHTHVRENILDLYGFHAMAELEFFEMLIGVPGIGPRSAIGILSIAPIDSLKRAVASGDSNYLTKVSGIGKRMAEKIIVELRDKLSGGGDVPTSEDANAVDALISLGYSSKEAREAVRKLPLSAASLDLKIKEALKILGGSGSSK